MTRVLFPSILLIVALTGCSRCDSETKGYDPDLRYPLRDEPLVLLTPPTNPEGPASPGAFAEAIAQLPDKGGVLALPAQLNDDARVKLTMTLDELFGTPAIPTLPDVKTIGDLSLSATELAAGSRAYRRLCVQCHGLTGNGRGPTGDWIYPHPRDFRRGIFKLATTAPKPTTESLTQLLRRGVPGTAMPLFDLISDEEANAVTSYMIHLSIRGEVEFDLLKKLLDTTGDLWVDDIGAECRATAMKVISEWQTSQRDSAVSVEGEADPESVRRGHELFVSSALGCVSCHKDYGREEYYLYDVWGGAVRPRDLRESKSRWSRDRDELIARVRAGIPSVGMPSQPTLTDQQVLDLANFLDVAAYPNRLPEDVRQKMGQ